MRNISYLLTLLILINRGQFKLSDKKKSEMFIIKEYVSKYGKEAPPTLYDEYEFK